jgi:CheY-like chemotaxis protein
MADEITCVIANPKGERELIMVVDDEGLVTLLVERVLTTEGYRVITASSGPQALAIYKKMRDYVDLVILDYKMPGMDGFALYNELRLVNPEIPAVLTSGFVDQEQLEMMLSKGLRGFIPKPLTQEKLLLKLRAIFDSMKGKKTTGTDLGSLSRPA